MLFDSYAILLGFQASLKSHNYCFDHRSKKLPKERADNSKRLFSQKQVNSAKLNSPTDQHFHLLKLKKS